MSSSSAPYQPSSEVPANPNTHNNNTPSSTTTTDIASQDSNGTLSGSGGSVAKKTEAEEAADRLYEERIEEEYAKREGGA